MFLKPTKIYIFFHKTVDYWKGSSKAQKDGKLLS